MLHIAEVEPASAAIEPLLSPEDLRRILDISDAQAHRIAREIGVRVGIRTVRVEPRLFREWLSARRVVR